METMMTNERSVRRRPLLWAGLLLPATAWALHLTISYVLATTACAESDPPLHAVTAILLATAAGGGWMAWTSWNAARADSDGTEEQRSVARFLALLGVLAAGLFGLAILTQGIPTLILGPCP
jgi:hypothetical protein